MDTLVTPTEPTVAPFSPGCIVTEDREDCKQAMVPVTEVLAQIGGKWTVHIIMALGGGPLRFSELLRGIEGISQKMLTATLRDLEKDGFVSRKVTPSIPPRVDYELTALGHSLLKPIMGLTQWALDNIEHIHGAQARFDADQARAEAA